MVDRDFAEAYELLVRYAVSIDDRDLAEVGRCFATDATANYAGIEAPPGRDGIVAFLGRALTSIVSSHVVGNVQVSRNKSDELLVRSSITATHVYEADGSTTVIHRGLVYLDELGRDSDGVLLISRRVHKPVWTIEGEVGAQ